MSPKKSTHSKTDVRYWLTRVYHRRFLQKGIEVVEPNYSVQIQYKGKRKRFQLKTPNKATAAARARETYMGLLENGWEEPNSQPKSTVGHLIATIETVSTARPVTLRNYFKNFRRIAADIVGIERSDDSLRSWKAEVDAIPLRELTPDRVIEWKADFLKGREASDLRSAKTTVNSMIRNAKALFGKKLLKYLAAQMDLPSPLPFDGVVMEKQPSARYQSKMNAAALLKDAEHELAPNYPESYKIFLLGLMCGLRRSEIDTLLWNSFDFENARLLVKRNEYTDLKSEDSAGYVDFEPGLGRIFYDFLQCSTSEFVVEANGAPLHRNVTTSYRAYRHFDHVVEWLRGKGISANKPLQELRKEFGSLINVSHGIYAASRSLRHSHIAVTVDHYTDIKERVTVGLKTTVTPFRDTA